MGNNYKICITGGPCGGITSMLRELKKLGYVIVPEVAQSLMAQDTSHNKNKFEFQKKFVEAQIRKEDECDRKNDHKFLVCDRGAADAYAFIDRDSFEKLGGQGLLKRYDCVIFAKSVANISEEIYNRHKRKKTAKEALETEAKLYEIWSMHPFFHVIKETADFEEKSQMLTGLIDTLIRFDAFMSKEFQPESVTHG